MSVATSVGKLGGHLCGRRQKLGAHRQLPPLSLPHVSRSCPPPPRPHCQARAALHVSGAPTRRLAPRPPETKTAHKATSPDAHRVCSLDIATTLSARAQHSLDAQHRMYIISITLTDVLKFASEYRGEALPCHLHCLIVHWRPMGASKTRRALRIPRSTPRVTSARRHALRHTFCFATSSRVELT